MADQEQEQERVREVIAMPSLDRDGNVTHAADAVVLGPRPRAEGERAAEVIELATIDLDGIETR